jgi:hypothetical protein
MHFDNLRMHLILLIVHKGHCFLQVLHLSHGLTEVHFDFLGQ